MKLTLSIVAATVTWVALGLIIVTSSRLPATSKKTGWSLFNWTGIARGRSQNPWRLPSSG